MNHKELHEEVDSHLHPRSYDPLTATAMQLSAIYKLLDERLPENPMTTLVPAARPGVEDAKLDTLNGRMVFNCRTNNADTLSVTKIADRVYEFYAENEVDEAETVIILSGADAKRLARAILDAT